MENLDSSRPEPPPPDRVMPCHLGQPGSWPLFPCQCLLSAPLLASLTCQRYPLSPHLAHARCKAMSKGNDTSSTEAAADETLLLSHKNAQNNDGILHPKTDVNWFTDPQIGSIGLGTCIPDICHFLYTSTFKDPKILHWKVRKFAREKTVSRQNSVNWYFGTLKFSHTVCKITNGV